MRPRTLALLGWMALLSGGAGGYYFFSYRPAAELAATQRAALELNAYFLARQDTLPDPAQARLLCHAVLRHRAADHHDAFIALIDYGDASSVPYLLKALRWQEPTADGNLLCTTAHCLEALRKLTGQNFSFDPDAWDQWYRTQHR